MNYYLKENLTSQMKEFGRKLKLLKTELIELKEIVMSGKAKSRLAVTKDAR